MDGELVLANPPEMGWTYANDDDEDSCDCEQACEPCLNALVEEATAHG